MKVIQLPVREKKRSDLEELVKSDMDWKRISHNMTRWACICFGSGLVMTEKNYVYRCRCEKGMQRAEQFPRYPDNIERVS